jgi:hypothetical protein
MLALFGSCRAVHAHLLIAHSSLHLIRAGEVDEIILTTSANNMSSSVQHVCTGNGGGWHLEVFKWSISLCASGQEGMLSTSQAINLNKLVCASACRGCAIVHRITLTGASLKARLQTRFNGSFFFFACVMHRRRSAYHSDVSRHGFRVWLVTAS